MKTLLWRGLDEPRMEIVRHDDRGRADGTQIGVAYELHWRLDGTRLELEVVGGVHRTVELGDAAFFDVQHSAYFNSLPVWRDGLLDGAPAREYTMRYVAVPGLETTPSVQVYEPRGGRTIHYRSDGFEADIEFDADGFVTLYTDYLERIA